MNSLEASSQNPWSEWAPSQKISFVQLKEMYPKIAYGDFVIVQKTDSSYSFWAFYNPATNGQYEQYSLGFSSDPTSIFYQNVKIKGPIIIKSDDKNLVSLLKTQMSKL